MNISLYMSVSFGMKINAVSSVKNLAKEVLLNEHKMVGYTAFTNADIFMPDNKIKKADLLFKDNKLIAINDFDETQLPENAHISLINLKNKYLTPAIVDQHIHGGFGLNFNEATKPQLESFLKKMPKYGCSFSRCTLWCLSCQRGGFDAFLRKYWCLCWQRDDG